MVEKREGPPRNLILPETPLKSVSWTYLTNFLRKMGIKLYFDLKNDIIYLLCRIFTVQIRQGFWIVFD